MLRSAQHDRLAGAAEIKILHISDVHLGTENYGHLDPSTGLNTRLLDFGTCLDAAVDAGLADGVDLAIFTGDAYRSRDPSPTHQREFARRIQRLVAASVPVYLLVGNHDLPLQTGKAHALDIFETLAIPGIYVGRRADIQVIQARSGRVQIASLPWIGRSALLSKDEHKNRPLDEINQLIAERIERIVRAHAQELDPALPAILCAHLSAMGAVYGSERSIMLGQDVAVPKSVLGNPAFDYVALGHIHKHQVLSTKPLMIYPGSIERVDFGEEDDPKGFVIVDLKKDETTYRFIPVPARPFVTIEVQARGDNPLDQVLAAIARAKVAGAIVRVLIETTPEKEPLIPYAEVRKALKDAEHVAAITKKVEREERHRIGSQMAEALSPLEALRLYLRTKEVPEERQDRLLQYADRLVRESP